MSIEKGEKLCYNKIRKTQEVQSDETLISTAFIHKISSFVHNDSGTDTHHSFYWEIFWKLSPSPLATEVLTRQKVVFSLENKKNLSFDRCGNEEAQADYEREEYKNDVRYQNRTEITLGYERKNVIKG